MIAVAVEPLGLVFVVPVGKVRTSFDRSKIPGPELAASAGEKDEKPVLGELRRPVSG